MLDHVFLTVADLERSIAFYEEALDGPEGHSLEAVYKSWQHPQR
jgi:catechol 2,3-dioxygenase-like lactoylglutathione lyase family enzyme